VDPTDADGPLLCRVSWVHKAAVGGRVGLCLRHITAGPMAIWLASDASLAGASDTAAVAAADLLLGLAEAAAGDLLSALAETGNRP
jgi:hypothetical protein